MLWCFVSTFKIVKSVAPFLQALNLSLAKRMEPDNFNPKQLRFGFFMQIQQQTFSLTSLKENMVHLTNRKEMLIQRCQRCPVLKNFCSSEFIKSEPCKIEEQRCLLGRKMKFSVIPY